MRSILFLATLTLWLAAAPAASSQSTSAEPNFGSLSLNEGFVPDPQTVSVTSGGSIDVDVGGCGYGFVSNAPDVDFYYTTSGGSDLYIYAVGDGDTTILVNTANGDWVCDDDSYGDGDPILVLPNAPDGLYNIWVGSYSNDFHDATLFVSEVDPTGTTSGNVSGGQIPDYTLEPNFDTLSLSEGFLPDPQSVSVTSGGGIEVGVAGCNYGFVSDAPDVDFYYTTSGGSDLYIYAVGDGDTTILVNTANGDWVCDDDSYDDGDPILVLPNAPDGLYNIWVGSYSNDFHDATLFVSEVDPTGTTSGNVSGGQTPDYSLAPSYGTETLEAGFLPDPYTVDVVAGGTIDLDMGECTYGYVAEAPDFDLYYETSGGSYLYIYAQSEDDTTLLVNDPNGNWICNDDAYGDGNPLIVVPAAEGGLYDIWVGSYNGDPTGATVYISEIDPR